MQKTIRLKGRRSLTASFSRAQTKSTDWIVFVQESGASFSRAKRSEINALLGSKLASRFHYLVINKPGLNPRGVDTPKFEKSFRRAKRVSDALETMKKIIPHQDHIYLIGYSEGAYLAPQIAQRDSRVKAVVMIGGGTRGWLKEEIAMAKKKRKIGLPKASSRNS